MSDNELQFGWIHPISMNVSPVVDADSVYEIARASKQNCDKRQYIAIITESLLAVAYVFVADDYLFKKSSTMELRLFIFGQ